MTITEYKSKLEKSLDFLKSDLAQIRTGRASPSMIESIQVDAYGSKMTILELGSITVLDTQTLAVTTWDKSLMSTVAKAIRESDLKLSPIEDSDRIRIPVPALTEDRRKEFTKVVSTKVEECKNAMRNLRQDGIKEVEKAFTDKEIGEDEKFKQKEHYDTLIKEYSEKSDALGDAKKDELMTI